MSHPITPSAGMALAALEAARDKFRRQAYLADEAGLLLDEIDRLRAEVASLQALHAERDALARLEAWRKAHPLRVPLSWCASGGWVVKLRGERTFEVIAYGWADAAPDCPDPTTVHCGDGAAQGECILAALDKWAELCGERQKGGA